MPYVLRSHPVVERLIGTVRRECLDRMLFWTAADLERKLVEFQQYYNEHRTHAGRGGRPPAPSPDPAGARASLGRIGGSRTVVGWITPRDADPPRVHWSDRRIRRSQRCIGFCLQPRGRLSDSVSANMSFYVTITTRNDTDRRVWVTIYDLAKTTHLDYGWVEPRNSRDWRAGNYLLGSFYHVRGEVKSDASGSDPNVFDTSIQISPHLTVDSGDVGPAHGLLPPPGHTTENQVAIGGKDGHYWWGVY